MSYQIATIAVANLQQAVDQLLSQNGVRTPGIGAELLAAGAVVTLDNGRSVWCSCVYHDLPETRDIDFLVAAFEVVDGAARVKPNGQLVGIVTWRTVLPEHISDWTVPTIRKACLMVALGEPQPQVPHPSPAEGQDTMMNVFDLPEGDTNNGCIRPMMDAADQLAAPLTNVL